MMVADSQPWLQPLPPFSGQELSLLKVTDSCDFSELAQAYWDDEVRRPTPLSECTDRRRQHPCTRDDATGISKSWISSIRRARERERAAKGSARHPTACMARVLRLAHARGAPGLRKEQ